MSKMGNWMIDIADKTAELMVTMGGSHIDKCEAYEMAEREMQRVDYDCTRFDVNALIDEAMELEGRTARTRWLNKMRWEFDDYMRYEMWDKLTYDGIYEDDAWHAIGAFVEFCEKGYVTDDDGHAFFVGADGCVHDYEAAEREEQEVPMNAPWSMTEDGQWILAEPYKTHLANAKLLATKAWVDEIMGYLAENTDYDEEQLLEELLRRKRTDNLPIPEMIDEFVIEAFEGDL